MAEACLRREGSFRDASQTPGTWPGGCIYGQEAKSAGEIKVGEGVESQPEGFLEVERQLLMAGPSCLLEASVCGSLSKVSSCLLRETLSYFLPLPRGALYTHRCTLQRQKNSSVLSQRRMHTFLVFFLPVRDSLLASTPANAVPSSLWPPLPFNANQTYSVPF